MPHWTVAQYVLAVGACVGSSGYAVLPGLVYQNAGWQLIADLCLALLLAFPLIWLQTAIGSVDGRGLALSLRRHAPILQGFGWTALLYCAFLTLQEVIPASLAGVYTLYTLAPPADLHDNHTHWAQDSTATAGYPLSSEELFFEKMYSRNSTELTGRNPRTSPELLGALVAVCLLLALLLSAGHRSFGWAVYLMTPLQVALSAAVIAHGFRNSSLSRNQLRDLFTHLPSASELASVVQSSALRIARQLVLLGPVPSLLGRLLNGPANITPPSALVFCAAFAILNWLPTLMLVCFVYNSDAQLLLPVVDTQTDRLLFSGLQRLFAAEPRSIRACFYSSLFIALCMRAALLALTIQDTVAELLRPYVNSSRSARYSFCTSAVGIAFSVILVLLATPLMMSNGWALQHLLDEGLWHFSCLQYSLLLIGLLLSLVKLPRPGKVHRIILGVLSCLSALGLIVAAAYELQKDSEFEEVLTELTPETTKTAVLWSVAALPLGVGALGGLLCVLCKKRCSSYSWREAFCGKEEVKFNSDRRTYRRYTLQVSNDS